MGQTLVPGGLWQIVEPLLWPRTERPQGGGTRYVDDRAVFTAVVYVLTTGCAWRHLPAEFGVSRVIAVGRDGPAVCDVRRQRLSRRAAVWQADRSAPDPDLRGRPREAGRHARGPGRHRPGADRAGSSLGVWAAPGPHRHGRTDDHRRRRSLGPDHRLTATVERTRSTSVEEWPSSRQRPAGPLPLVTGALTATVPSRPPPESLAGTAGVAVPASLERRPS